MTTSRSRMGRGPFRAEHVRHGDRYELSNGHPVFYEPAGRRGGRANLAGGEALESDPEVTAAGVDVGFSHEPGYLRAPDISVGDFADEPGWAPGAPPLAVEYADTGQNETDLRKKISELLAGGTRYLWVVRLVGPRRVEVHEPGKPMRVATVGDELRAPGVLRNPVPVLALFDREAAHAVTVRNLLQRRGYQDLDAVLAEGRAQGEATGRAGAVVAVLRARGLKPTDAQVSAIVGEKDLARLHQLLTKAAKATSMSDLFPVKPLRKRARRSRPR